MDAPEISTLRDEEEESPPPEAFNKFRVNVGRQWAAGSAPATAGQPSATGPRGEDSEDEEEEDQLIDDDELAIVAETGHGPGGSQSSMVIAGSPASSPKKRGGATRGRQRRGGLTGRRGRPGREPPDAAAMMSTFEVAKADQQGGMDTAQIITPATAMPGSSQPQASDDQAWSTAPPPKPPRKKPGPKKGTTLGPRGPRKAGTKTAQNTPGTSTPIGDDHMGSDATSFLVPIPPSIPSTPKSDHPGLPPNNYPTVPPPDFTLEPNVPVPLYPLPTRSFPVQAPPKIPTGYAPSHPIDTKRGPVRKWAVMQREIRGIAGGRWFARTWVAPSTLPHNMNAMGVGLDTGAITTGQNTRPPSPLQASAFPPLLSGMSQLDNLALIAASSSRLPSVKPEVQPETHLSPPSAQDREPMQIHDVDQEVASVSAPIHEGLLSRGPASRTSASHSPAPMVDEDVEMLPPPP
ncbi:hypothetical protein M422DRAFT_24640 [Sphaerobolus stellatus SS14]|nr:hypothetical protein M422DRAFT_24640 [Sphaerobolus stellatus SS14]